MTDKPDEAVVAMIRCYLSQKRVSWPYLAVLVVAIIFVAIFPFFAD